MIEREPLMYKLITGAKIITMDKENPRAEAALVLGDYFAFVGSEKGAREFLDKRGLLAEEYNAGGASLLPGFNDAHLHFLHYVKAKKAANLFDEKSLAGVIERMREAYESHDKNSPLWIVGEGWNQDYFLDEKRFPLGRDLDAITEDYPIIIMRACFHIGVLNSKAMELVGLKKEDALKHPGYIDLDEDGQLTGVVREYVFDDIKAKIPAPSIEELVEDLLESQEDLWEQGITSVQSDDVKYVPGSDYGRFCELMRRAGEEKKLKLRYSLQALVDNLDDLEEFFDRGFGRDYGNRRFNISCIKVLTDGSLGARTAYLRKPYEDDGSTRGLAIYGDEELKSLAFKAQEKAMPLALHAIGDGAIDQCLNALEYAKNLLPHHKPRHGIVHAQITDGKMISRFKELGVSVFAQPIFIHYDMHMVEARVGRELASTSYAWKSFKDLGVVLASSTDAPVEPFSTMPNIYSAVTRRDLSGAGPFLADQALSMEEALESYTLSGAYMSGEENDKGMIKAGYLADFIILDRDILEVEEKEILEVKVAKTFFSGELVFER